jgi:hypothetical protein
MRAADTWEPLIAIADLAGGAWPARARDAAATMTTAEAQQEEDTAAGVRLLADLRQVFQAADTEALYTSTILEALHQLEDAPWADWYGHPLTTRDLARLLRPYQVESKNVRERGTGQPRKGYARADLQDAWARYVPLHALHALQEPEFAGQPGSGHVADVAAPPASNGNGWHYDQPLVPCAVCGTGTSNRAPAGRPLHMACAARTTTEGPHHG